MTDQQDQDDLAALERRFALPGVRIVAGPAGLPVVRVETPHASGEVHLHGAQPTRWRPEGHDEVLFLSAASRWVKGEPIRGGIPLVFPWFREHPTDPGLPSHGFARRRMFALEAIRQDDRHIRIAMKLVVDDASRKLWPHDFRIEHEVAIGETLEMKLRVTNPAFEPFEFEAVWHTYLAVSDVRQVSVFGLEDTEFVDLLSGGTPEPQRGAIMFAAETDRVHLGAERDVEVVDPGAGRRVTVHRTGAPSTVVWTPFEDKARRMPDFGDDEWPRTLCIETGNVRDDRVRLAAGATHVSTTTLAVERL